jgi:hypothetical protein
MGLQVIAEGIEDLDQADWLLRHGCAMAQGYAFGRPAPLPARTEALVEDIVDAPVAEMAEQTPGPLAAAYDLPPGALREGAAKPEAHRPEITQPEIVFPVQRNREQAEDLVASTGEFDAPPEDPED